MPKIRWLLSPSLLTLQTWLYVIFLRWQHKKNRQRQCRTFRSKRGNTNGKSELIHIHSLFAPSTVIWRGQQSIIYKLNIKNKKKVVFFWIDLVLLFLHSIMSFYVIIKLTIYITFFFKRVLKCKILLKITISQISNHPAKTYLDQFLSTLPLSVCSRRMQITIQKNPNEKASPGHHK